MRAIGQTPGRFLGYVEVQVASRTYAVRVEALPTGTHAPEARPGFFTDGDVRFGIRVNDADSADAVQRAIEQGTVEVANHISRTLLN